MQPTSCPSCKHINPPGSNFCNVCGTALPSLQCPHCGSLNDVAVAVQCHACGGSLLAPASAPAWTAPPTLTRAAPDTAVLAGGGRPDAAVPLPPERRDDTIAQLFSHPAAVELPPERASVALQTYEPPAPPVSDAVVRPVRRRGVPIAAGIAAAVALAAGAFYLLPSGRSGAPSPASTKASAATVMGTRPAPPGQVEQAAQVMRDATAAATARALARAEALLNDAPTGAGPAASAETRTVAPPPAPPASLSPPVPRTAAALTPAASAPAAARPVRVDASPVVDAAISRRDAEPAVSSTPAQPAPCTDAIAALGLCSR